MSTSPGHHSGTRSCPDPERAALVERIKEEVMAEMAAPTSGSPLRRALDTADSCYAAEQRGEAAEPPHAPWTTCHLMDELQERSRDRGTTERALSRCPVQRRRPVSNDLNHALDQANRVIAELANRAPAVFERDQRGGDNHRDGYPSSTSGGGAHTPYTVDSTSSTARAAEDLLEHGDRADPLHAITTGITRDLDTAVKALQAAISKVALAEHLANPDGRSNPPTHCAACARLVMCTSVDPIRSGYCSACAVAYRRYKAECVEDGLTPDRASFEAARRKEPAA